MSSTHEYRWPPPVKPGEVIAVAAPASPVDHAECQAGLRLLEAWGFQVRCGAEVWQSRAWGPDTDRQLARRFLEIWQQPEVKAVLGARGGYGSLKLLPHLAADLPKSRPKRLMGFSDLTNLLWDVHRRLDLVTFHGPTLAHLPHLTPAAQENFYNWLTSPSPLALSYQDLTVLQEGTGVGPLAGGNLTTLCHLLGTPFAPQFDGYVLFLEDHNEALYRLDRLMHHLLLSGALEGVKGVVLGAFTACDHPAQVPEVLRLALEALKVPVLAGMPVGHQPDNHTLPLGARVRVDSATASLTFL